MTIGTFLNAGLALGTLAVALQAQPVFTGDADADFMGLPGLLTINDPNGNDVGIPNGAPAGTISGWDINRIHMYYDHGSDIMYVGLNCFGQVCGDADGDGDGDTEAQWFLDNLGVDHPDYGGTEFFSLIFDSNTNGTLDSGVEPIIGIPGNGNFNNLQAAVFTGTPFAPGFAFGAPLANMVTAFASPHPGATDLELAIHDFSTLPGFSFMPGEAFAFGVNVANGSIDDDGVGEDFVPGAGAITTIELPPGESADASDLPTGFRLEHNVPNPFNPSTLLSFSMEETAFATLAVYDMRGALVRTLHSGLLQGGEHTRLFDAAGLASGVYIARLSSGEQSRSIRMTLVK